MPLKTCHKPQQSRLPPCSLASLCYTELFGKRKRRQVFLDLVKNKHSNSYCPFVPKFESKPFTLEPVRGASSREQHSRCRTHIKSLHDHWALENWRNNTVKCPSQPRFRVYFMQMPMQVPNRSKATLFHLFHTTSMNSSIPLQSSQRSEE